MSAACGLYYLAELIEEFTLTTKRLLTWSIRIEILIHLLLFIDKMPAVCILLGIASQFGYMRLLRQFPYMRLTSPEGVVSIILFAASSIEWIRYFWSYQTVEFIASFMLVTTWIVPFVLFLGLASDQSVLPGAGGYPYSTIQADRRHSSVGLQQQGEQNRQRSRRGFALKIFDLLRKKRDEVLPDAVSKLPGSAGLFKEKI